MTKIVNLQLLYDHTLLKTMKNLFITLIFAALMGLIGCTYKSIPTVSRETGGFKTPAVHEAKDGVPQEVPSARSESQAKAKQSDKTIAVVDDNESQQSIGEVERLAPVVVATSSREREHVSFTSYNPFVNGDSFVVNLDSLAEGFCYPIEGHLLSPYGKRGRGWHSGADLKGLQGDPIYAAFDGVVRMSRYYGGYGNVIVIRHNNGLETAYSHNNENLVSVGDVVQAGDRIATCGRTGRATGTHCHFEVRIIGQALNPALILDFENKRLQKGVLYVARSSASKVTASRKNNGDKFDNTPRPAAPTEKYLASNEETKTSVSEKTTQAATASTTSLIHKIVKGDTLGALAKKYGTSIQALCALNKITTKTLLQLGQKLKVK